MSEFQPIETIEEYLSLDEDEVVAGYWAGFKGEPEPGNTYSRSYWHGWKNGATDIGARTMDLAQARLAAACATRIQHSSRIQ
jgi:hypothetical protein